MLDARRAATVITGEIASRAFVSLKTVETTLSRAYAKLSVRSRTPLVQAMAARNPPAHRG